MQREPKKIELLAPARNLSTAITAINHGADAIYIGAHSFGARHAAGNSIEDIARVVDYAHIFGVKVYVTLNTIFKDEEIPSVEKLVAELYEVGVDALIVQDMAFFGMNIPPIPLHASTQTDNRTPEKVRFLADVGFPRVVLARELSLQQISEIHSAAPDTELEVFVHGALCVSYSGRCYASQHCFDRSANKGACAQFCRLPFSLVDADGAVVCKDKHLLSLKDMNRSEWLEDLLDAGVVSLKIEGRLKDESYVKNITAYYRSCLDALFARRKEYVRTSFGKTSPHFIPAPEKAFNRGFTDYMLDGTKHEIVSLHTPKSLGEKMGRVRIVARNFFTISGKTFNNGDGACFIGNDEILHGFRINKVESNRIFPHAMPPIYPGAEIYRNNDSLFERQLARPDVPRRLSLEIVFSETSEGFAFKAKDESGCEAMVEVEYKKELARTSQRDNIEIQLKKWGNTPFEVSKTTLELESEWFIPSSLLSDMRRRLCDELLQIHRDKYQREDRFLIATSHKYPEENLDYTGNVSNSLSRDFYHIHKVKSVSPAYELNPPDAVPIMFCKHCIKYTMGWCSKNGKKTPYREPFTLVASDGRRFPLEFDCKQCIMKVYSS